MVIEGFLVLCFSVSGERGASTSISVSAITEAVEELDGGVVAVVETKSRIISVSIVRVQNKVESTLAAPQTNLNFHVPYTASSLRNPHSRSSLGNIVLTWQCPWPPLTLS